MNTQHMTSPYDIHAPMELPQPARLAPPVYGSQHRQEMIEQAAYFRAKHRGFTPGHELEDWLAAEAEVDGVLSLCLHS